MLEWRAQQKKAAIYRIKPSRDWLEKINERASLEHNRDASFLKYHIPVSVYVRMEMQLKTKASIEGHQKLQKQVEDLTNQINRKKKPLSKTAITND